VIDHRVLVGGATLLLAVVAAVATRRLRFPLPIFNTVIFVVVVSTLAQRMTLEPFVRRLGLTG
jgi:NhaP-type Na+/H+ and K+/H+ antiporter